MLTSLIATLLAAGTALGAEHLLVATGFGGDTISFFFDDTAGAVRRAGAVPGSGGRLVAVSPNAQSVLVGGPGNGTSGNLRAYTLATDGTLAASGPNFLSGGDNVTAVAVRLAQLGPPQKSPQTQFSLIGNSVIVGKSDISAVESYAFLDEQARGGDIKLRQTVGESLGGPTEVTVDPSGEYVFASHPVAHRIYRFDVSSTGSIPKQEPITFPTPFRDALPISTIFTAANVTRMFSLLSQQAAVTLWSLCYRPLDVFLETLQAISTLENTSGQVEACSQAVSPDGRLLLVGNCGTGGAQDSLALFTIDHSVNITDPLRRVGLVATTGVAPRSIDWEPIVGQYVAVAYTQSAFIAILNVSTTGVNEVARLYDVPNASSVKWVAPYAAIDLATLQAKCDRTVGSFGGVAVPSASPSARSAAVRSVRPIPLALFAAALLMAGSYVCVHMV